MDSLFGNDRIDGVVESLWRACPWWPQDSVKDRAMMAQLMAEYPSLDLATEATKFSAWMLDHDSKGKKVRPRARFTNWCCNAVRYSRTRRTANGKGSTRRVGTHTGGTPSPRSQFAGSGYREW